MPVAGGNDHPYPPLRLQEVQYETRSFALDVLKCAECGARRRWIAALTERSVIVRILEHLGLSSQPPIPAPARAPPQMELGF